MRTDREPRLTTSYLWGTLAICLVLGVPMLIDPSLSRAVWPYPVKSLATRMFGAVLVALAVAAANTLRGGRTVSGRGALFTVAPIFGGILAAALLSSGKLVLGAPHVEVWLVVFGAVTVLGAAVIAMPPGMRGGASTGTASPRGLRIALLLHTLIVLFFGLNMFFLPTLAQNFWPWKVSPAVMQGLGGFFLGSTVGTWWSFRQKTLERVRTVLPAYAVFTGLVLVAVLLESGVVASESPGPQVTIAWLGIYVYVTVYASFYTLWPRRSKT